MPSYSSWNGVKCSGSKQLLTDILKGELGFQGFLISDYAAIDQLPGDYRSDVKTSINAGMDMVMVPQKYQEFIATLKSLVEAGEVPQARVDDAVRRILRVKFAMGLMPGAQAASDPALAASFGSAEHRAVARRAVRESLVLLKNDKHALPLKKTLKRIHVAGRGADDMPMQAGGWTVQWQGLRIKGKPTSRSRARRSWRRSRRPRRDHERDVLEGRLGRRGRRRGRRGRGRGPYAEFEGDRTDLSLGPEDRSAIAAAKQTGAPVVVVLLSGRAMIVTRRGRAGRRVRGGLAAGDRRRGRRRRAVRRLQAHGQAAGHVAAVDGPDPDERRRRHVRPAVQVRLRADVLAAIPIQPGLEALGVELDVDVQEGVDRAARERRARGRAPSHAPAPRMPWRSRARGRVCRRRPGRVSRARRSGGAARREALDLGHPRVVREQHRLRLVADEPVDRGDERLGLELDRRRRGHHEAPRSDASSR